MNKCTAVIKNEYLDNDLIFTSVIGIFTSDEKLNDIKASLVDTDTVFYEYNVMDFNVLYEEPSSESIIESGVKNGYLEPVIDSNGYFEFLPTSKLKGLTNERL